MKLSPEQQAIRTAILKEARARGLPARGRKVVSALETGIVESNLRNLPGGDADSQGWRQERKSLYPNPRNVQASVKRYFDEAAKADTGKGSAGQLAARVQRPAAQYRGRYDQHRSEAFSLLGGGSSSGTPGSPSRTTTTTTPGVDNSDVRRQLVAQYLTAGHQSSDDLLNLAVAVRGAKDTPGTSSTVTASSTQGMAPSSGGSSLTAKFRQAANKIDAQHLPYSWGGGHGGKTAPGAGVPLDCSGAVSSVLGINPRVASQFKTFGSPGRAPGGKGVTIYAAKDGSHVLLEVDGRFFGTSRTNPGGGAGWIPRAAINSAYLSRFTARHLARSVHA